MNTYDRIAQVIRYIDEHKSVQPDLASLAQFAGLSPSHFHRLFSSWAAITPKDFLQCLTVSHAKQLLRDGRSVLDAAVDSGLSGPGRLHDLCVNLEAASPGELKAGGDGWVIVCGFADSPFGRCLIAESPRGICHIAFIESEDGKAELKELQIQWPNARLQRDDMAASRWAEKIFRHPASPDDQPPLRALVRGTEFQVQVWRALLQVRAGTLTSYGQLAGLIGKPAAARAVGSAIGQNSLAFLIPCHRVIRETGVIGQYRWGRVRKQAMLAWESAPVLSGTLVAGQATEPNHE